jgi:hypothetical protein
MRRNLFASGTDFNLKIEINLTSPMILCSCFARWLVGRLGLKKPDGHDKPERGCVSNRIRSLRSRMPTYIDKYEVACSA